MNNLIPVGEIAPDFTAITESGETIHLSELRSKKRVVLVFYPGDNTSLCTAQLCAFRDDWSRFEAEESVVFGVNPANQARHQRFAGKYHFPFPLLVDAGGKIAAAFGCRGLFGVIRRTVYLLDKQGKVIYAERGNPAPEILLNALHNVKDEET